MSTGSRDFVVDAIEAAACWLCESASFAATSRASLEAERVLMLPASREPDDAWEEGPESSPPPNASNLADVVLGFKCEGSEGVGGTGAGAGAGGATGSSIGSGTRGAGASFGVGSGNGAGSGVGGTGNGAGNAVGGPPPAAGMVVLAPPKSMLMPPKLKPPKASAGSVDSGSEAEPGAVAGPVASGGMLVCMPSKFAAKPPKAFIGSGALGGGSGTLSVAGTDGRGRDDGGAGAEAGIGNMDEPSPGIAGDGISGMDAGAGGGSRVGSGTDNPANASPTEIPPTGSGVGTSAGAGAAGVVATAS